MQWSGRGLQFLLSDRFLGLNFRFRFLVNGFHRQEMLTKGQPSGFAYLILRKFTLFRLWKGLGKFGHLLDTGFSIRAVEASIWTVKLCGYVAAFVGFFI